MYLLPQVWNRIIADNQRNLGKLGRVKFIHMAVNGGECNVKTLFAENALIIRNVSF